MTATVFDTIAAVATPAGRGGIAVIRISGPASIEIGDRVFVGARRPADVESHTALYGHVADPATAEVIDEVILTVFRAPRSYTGEDMVELSCHGSPVIADRVVGTLFGLGARLAQPGEFTRRAVFNRRLDLVQAEAVLDLIESKTDKARQAALRQLDGALSREFDRLTEEVKSAVSRLEATLEFPEDAVGPEPAFVVQIRRLAVETRALLRRGEESKHLRDGAAVVVVGRPNVGKSSLFNRLLDEDRALVTAIPGTTRDAIEASVSRNGVPLRLYDTCGLLPAPDVETASVSLEALGADKTRFYLDRADLVLAVFDRSLPVSDEDAEILTVTKNRPRLVVLNKIDLPARFDDGIFNGDRVVPVSAKYGTGIDLLNRRLVEAFAVAAADDTAPRLTNRRHLDALGRTADALDRSLVSPYPELRAFELKAALAALGEITGETTPEEILDRIFSQFCVGK